MQMGAKREKMMGRAIHQVDCLPNGDTDDRCQSPRTNLPLGEWGRFRGLAQKECARAAPRKS
jgi:hypothetical protein